MRTFSGWVRRLIWSWFSTHRGTERTFGGLRGGVGGGGGVWVARNGKEGWIAQLISTDRQDCQKAERLRRGARGGGSRRVEGKGERKTHKRYRMVDKRRTHTHRERQTDRQANMLREKLSWLIGWGKVMDMRWTGLDRHYYYCCCFYDNVQYVRNRKEADVGQRRLTASLIVSPLSPNFSSPLLQLRLCERILSFPN